MDLLIIIALDVEHVDVMENVHVILDSVVMLVNVEFVKERQQSVLDMEHVNVMEIVHVTKDGQIQFQLFKSVIAQQSVLPIVLTTENVFVEYVIAMQTGPVNLIVDVLIHVLNNVIPTKYAHVMEPANVSLDSMDQTVLKFLLVQTSQIVQLVWQLKIVDGVMMLMFARMFSMLSNVVMIIFKIHVGLFFQLNV